MRRGSIRSRKMSYAGSRPSAFTLIEVVFAIGVIAVVLVPAIGTIQLTRVRTRAVGLNLIGQNLSVAMMELIKRSGYNEIAYGSSLPGILDTSEAPNPLLDFPRSLEPREAPTALNLSEAGPGSAGTQAMAAFLRGFRGGDPDHLVSNRARHAGFGFIRPLRVLQHRFA